VHAQKPAQSLRQAAAATAAAATAAASCARNSSSASARLAHRNGGSSREECVGRSDDIVADRGSRVQTAGFGPAPE
jgi:hypothetical protein